MSYLLNFFYSGWMYVSIKKHEGGSLKMHLFIFIALTHKYWSARFCCCCCFLYVCFFFELRIRAFCINLETALYYSLITFMCSIFYTHHFMYCRSKKNRNTLTNCNKNLREMKLVPINMDYCLFQFDALKFVLGVHLFSLK